MRFLIYIAPFLPTIIYVLYYIIRDRKRGRGEVLLGIRQGKWFRVVIVSIFLFVCVVIMAALGGEQNRGKNYEPAKFENGVLTPNRIID